MMSFCPKCRTFYDDADLKFCLTDGVPLVNIKENGGDLWNEAVEAISQTKNRIWRETRRRQIKKIVSILITTILTILIISIITINGWLYFNPEKEETVSVEKSFPTPEPTVKNIPAILPSVDETISPTPLPTIEQTVSPTPTVAQTVSPIPIVEPDVSPNPVNEPDVTPTPVTPTPVPSPSVTPTPVRTPQSCSLEEKTAAKLQIEKLIGNSSNKEFSKGESKVRKDARKDILRECERRGMADNCEPIIIEAQIKPGRTTVQNPNVFSDCKTAQAVVSFEWLIIAGQFPAMTRSYTKTFFCRKVGNGWICGSLF